MKSSFLYTSIQTILLVLLLYIEKKITVCDSFLKCWQRNSLFILRSLIQVPDFERKENRCIIIFGVVFYWCFVVRFFITVANSSKRAAATRNMLITGPWEVVCINFDIIMYFYDLMFCFVLLAFFERWRCCNCHSHGESISFERISWRRYVFRYSPYYNIWKFFQMSQNVSKKLTHTTHT